MMFAVLLTAVTWNFPPCTPEQALTPDQAALGAEYDAAWAPARLATNKVVGGGEACVQYASHVAPGDRWRVDLATQTCRSSIVVSGVVRGRGIAFVTPGRRYIWTEYSFRVDGVYKSPEGFGFNGPTMVAGREITVVREGGSVCTSAGELHAISDTQYALEDGGRYLLFLTSKHGRYLTSENDYRLGDETSARAGATDYAPMSTGAVIMAVTGARCGR